MRGRTCRAGPRADRDGPDRRRKAVSVQTACLRNLRRGGSVQRTMSQNRKYRRGIVAAHRRLLRARGTTPSSASTACASGNLGVTPSICSDFGNVEREPSRFLRTFGAVAVMHFALAVGGTRQFDHFAHGHGFVGCPDRNYRRRPEPVAATGSAPRSDSRRAAPARAARDERPAGGGPPAPGRPARREPHRESNGPPTSRRRRSRCRPGRWPPRRLAPTGRHRGSWR